MKVNAIITCCVAMVFYVAVSEQAHAQDKKGTKATTTAKPKWVDPRKGMMWGRVNMVKIPLSAYENHIFGKVKTVSYKRYLVAEADGSKRLEDSGYNVYNKEGNLVSQDEYKANGTARWHCRYKYNSNGKPKEFLMQFEDTMENMRTTFVYDSIGRKQEEIELDADTNYSARSEFDYDLKNRQVGETRRLPSGKILWISAYNYDERGFQTEYVVGNTEGKLLVRRIQEYDDDGNAISGQVYSKGDSVASEKWKSKVDEKGRISGMAIYKRDNSLGSISKFAYDDRDNPVEMLTYKPDGSLDTAGANIYTEYKYDAKGNVTKETQYKLKDGKRVMAEMTEKKYTYY